MESWSIDNISIKDKTTTNDNTVRNIVQLHPNQDRSNREIQFHTSVKVGFPSWWYVSIININAISDPHLSHGYKRISYDI